MTNKQGFVKILFCFPLMNGAYKKVYIRVEIKMLCCSVLCFCKLKLKLNDALTHRL